MTTEDDFQKALSAHPDDWQTRLIFAYWLDDRADPRAEGYRALGRLRYWPFRSRKRHWWTAEGDGFPYHNHLPPDWFEQVAGYPHRSKGRWRWPDEFDEAHDNRRAIEDAAALAFARLPAARRAELLAAPPPENPTAPRNAEPPAEGPKAPRGAKAPAKKAEGPTRKPKAPAETPKPRRSGKKR